MIFGGKWYALKDYPALGSKHSPTRMISTMWARSRHICESAGCPSLHTNSRWTLNLHCLRIQTSVFDTEQDLAVYILKGVGGGRGWWRWRRCMAVVLVLEGGFRAGYGAKWKHVTQDPLKRNPAQQKKETHIIIKSSRGEAKTANIIPAPPTTTTTTPNTHTHTHTNTLNTLLPFLSSKWQKMGRLELRCVWPLPENDKMMFGNFLITVCLFSRAGM